MLFSVFNVQIGAVWFVAMLVGQQLAALLDRKTTVKPKGEEPSRGSNGLIQNMR